VLAARTMPTAGELRKIAAAHADLAHTCGRLLPDHLSELTDSYTDRAAAYRDLAAAASRVASIHRGAGLVLVQTAELTRLLQHTAPRAPTDVLAGVLADLDTAYPVFSRAIATQVARGLQTGAYLVPHPHTLEHRWEHPRPGHPAAARLHQAATLLKVGDRSADQRATDHAASLRRPGRPPALTPDQITAARQLLQTGDRTQRQVAAQLGVGLSTLKRALHPTPGNTADDVRDRRADGVDPADPGGTADRGHVLTTTVLRQARELTGTGHTLHQAADQLQVGVDRLRAALRDPTEPCSPVADPARHALAAALARQPVGRRPVTPGHPVSATQSATRSTTRSTTPPSPRQQP
jgi:hypothetical protein